MAPPGANVLLLAPPAPPPKPAEQVDDPAAEEEVSAAPEVAPDEAKRTAHGPYDQKQILDYALRHSVKEAAQKFGVSQSTLYYWRSLAPATPPPKKTAKRVAPPPPSTAPPVQDLQVPTAEYLTSCDDAPPPRPHNQRHVSIVLVCCKGAMSTSVYSCAILYSGGVSGTRQTSKYSTCQLAPSQHSDVLECATY